ncbi:MAG TPA: DnaA/Hda family protein [Rhabdochlamydiaceae bacterium]|nr:DnaA/Hda family protein [Rhabdochlamydiaceae bacterium]
MRAWEEFLQAQVKELGSEAIEKWAKTLKVVFFDAGNLYLEAQDSFQVNWFEEHLRPKVRQFFRNNNQRLIQVHVSLANAPKAKKIWKPVLNLSPDSLDPGCRLETYFPGATNLTSFSLLKESLEKPAYNPIYLHGPSGTGKSHLLMASSFYLTAQKKQCFYVTASTLTNHIVAAMRTGGMQALRELYRKHDVLLVDDVHQLSHRSATQEELFHTFNTLHVAGKQIILASDSLPSLLEGIEPRLTSRFEWGLVLPFQPLNSQEQKEFFNKRAEEKKLELPQEIEGFLLGSLTSVKSLQSALETIHLRKGKNQITVPLLQKWIEPLLEDQKRKALTPEKIIQAAAEIFEIQSADILGRSQNQECSLPRQVAMYLCRLMLKMPYLKIAAAFSRDHSTVMTSVKSVDKKIGEHDNVMLSTINSIKSKLKS